MLEERVTGLSVRIPNSIQGKIGRELVWFSGIITESRKG